MNIIIAFLHTFCYSHNNLNSDKSFGSYESFHRHTNTGYVLRHQNSRYESKDKFDTNKVNFHTIFDDIKRTNDIEFVKDTLLKLRKNKRSNQITYSRFINDLSKNKFFINNRNNINSIYPLWKEEMLR